MPADLKRIKEVFVAAVEKPGFAERLAFLQEACGADNELRQQVEALLRQHEQASGFLESPPPGLGQTADSNEGDAAVTASQATAPMEAVGSRIGPYKLLQRLGEGGMGTVYLAEQEAPVKRRVALKIIKAGMDSAHVIARFEQERQALAMMDHPMIAKVLDAGTTEAGRPYFVMEVVKGIPITRYCDQEHLTPKERLELFIPVCQAVQHAHQKGIIHRDLKPSNVLIALYDGKAVPKVIDFGVAKATGQKLTERTMFTEVGQIVGTLEYMAPEQAELNNLDIDTRADIYSLGVLLYELLTGSTPFTAKQLRSAAFDEMLRIIREVEPPKPSTKLSSSDELPSIAANRKLEPARLTKLVHGDLDWIAMKCLAKERSRRYETANGLAMDIQRYLADEPVLAGPPSAAYRLRKFVRRNKRGLVTAALLGVILLAAVGTVAGTLGWAARDRAARRLVVEQAVGRALEQADELQKQGKWQEGLAAVERAEAALASGEGGADLQRQVADQLAALRMIDRLEEIRARRADAFDGERANREYALVFVEFGIDVERLSPAEIAAQIRRRPATAVRMAAALDDWAAVRRNEKHGSAAWKHYLEAARLADPDPWRGQLRQFLGREDTDALRILAGTSDIATLPVQSLQLLGTALVFGGDRPACVAWLRKAHRQHPGDVWLSFDLAFHLSQAPSPPWPEVLQFHEAALAARPQSAALHRGAGFYLFKLDRHDEAIAACRKAIELKPDDAESQNQLAWHLATHPESRFRNPAESVRLAKKAVELAPKWVPYWNTLGVAHYRAGDWKLAKEALEKSLELHKNSDAFDWFFDAFDWFFLAMAQWQLNQKDEARMWYDRAVEWTHRNQPGDGELRRFRAEAAKLLGIEFDPRRAAAQHNPDFALAENARLDAAIAKCNKTLALNPKDVGTHHQLASALYKKGDTAGAVAALQKANEIDASAWAYRSLAQIRLERGEVKTAAEDGRRAVELDPDDIGNWVEHGPILLLAGDAHGYRQLCAQVQIRFGQSKVATIAGRVARLCSLAAGDGSDAARAVQLADKCAAEWRTSWRVHTLGLAQYRAGQFDKAVMSLNESLAIDPDWEGVFCNWIVLALAHHRLGKIKEAEQWLDKAGQWMDQRGLKKGVEYVGPLFSISAHDWLEGRVLRREAEALIKGTAKDWAEAASTLHQKFHAGAHYYYWLGRDLHTKGKIPEAIQAFRQAIEGDPKVADAHFFLGDALNKQGDLIGAVTPFRTATELDSKHLRARQELATVYVTLGLKNLMLRETITAKDYYYKNFQIWKDWAAVHPDDADAKLLLGNAHFYLAYFLLGTGDAKAANEESRKGLELRPDNLVYWRQRAPILLLAGDTEGYEQLCVQALDRFGGSKEPQVSYHVARACTMGPAAAREPGRVVQLAAQGVAEQRTGSRLHALGLAHYRAGQLDQAVKLVHESLAAEPNWEGISCNWLVLAMAHHRLGHTREAEQWLSKAALWMESRAPKTGSEYLGPLDGLHPYDWLAGHVLHREAEALLRGPDKKQPPK